MHKGRDIIDAKIKSALEKDLTIDITTRGRKSGLLRRVEIWFHNVDGHLYITGLPGTRGWYANMTVDPVFTFHLKESVQADIPARARLIEEEAERRRILTRIIDKLEKRGETGRDLEAWIGSSPLIEVDLDID